VYYHLKSAATGPVTLEVFDAAKKLVRRYSSADQPEPIDPALDVPTYWVRPPAILSASAGMHRFVWDMHYPPPDALTHEYPISAVVRDTPRYPLGAAAPPGQYSLKLSVDGKSYTQPLTVKMDPRVKTSPAALLRQFTLATKITDMMHRDSEALRVKPEQQDAELTKDLTKLNADLITMLDVIESADAAPTTQAAAAVAQLERTLQSLLVRVK
jgi:hypothetical protein